MSEEATCAELVEEIAQLRYQLRRLVDAYLIMCDQERDSLVEEAELILDKS